MFHSLFVPTFNLSLSSARARSLSLISPFDLSLFDHSPMSSVLALVVEFREEVAVVLCMVVFAFSAALVLADILARDLERPTGSLARREPVREAPALSEVAACTPRQPVRQGDDSPKTTTTTINRPTVNPTTTGDVRRPSPSCESAPVRKSGPVVIQRRVRASELRGQTVLTTTCRRAMPSTVAGAQGSCAQGSSWSKTTTLASIPEDQCIGTVCCASAHRQESPDSLCTCRDFKAAVTDSLRLTLRGSADPQAEGMHAVCRLRDGVLTLDMQQRTAAGEKTQVVVAEVPVEALAVGLQRSRANMFTIATVYQNKTFDEIYCFCADPVRRDRWIAIFRRMGVAIGRVNDRRIPRASESDGPSGPACSVTVVSRRLNRDEQTPPVPVGRRKKASNESERQRTEKERESERDRERRRRMGA